jgi:glycosyltransferase involved in cell wall biosynthesis
VERPIVVFARPGPGYAPETLEFRLARLFGLRYDGEIWTTGEALTRQEEGELTVVSYAFRHRLRDRLKAWFGFLGRGLRLHFGGRSPEVIVAYDPFASGTLALALKWVTGARFICEVNGTYGASGNYVEAAGSPLIQFKQRLQLRVGSFVLNRADCVKLLYPGQLAGLPVREERLRTEIFFDSVDSSSFSREPSVEQEDVILFAGTPFLLKGIDLLLEAFGRLKDEFPTWRLVLLGWDLEGGAARHGSRVPEGTEFLGAVTPAEVAEWMDRCKIVALPSRSEGLPRVLLEAGLKGRARVASAVGGVPHLIQDGVDGLIFPAGDVDALTEKLRSLITDQELRSEIEQEARRVSLDLFRDEMYLARYVELIEAVRLGGGRPGSTLQPGTGEGVER